MHPPIVCRPALQSARLGARLFHSSGRVSMPRQAPGSSNEKVSEMDALGESFQDDDTTVAGHLVLRQQRHDLHYLRLIEHEMPKLVAFRKPFIPPTAETPLIVRTLSYSGEEHPATIKRVVVVPVARLPLKTGAAIHKLKLLAGVRWTPDPPADSGVGRHETGGNHGFIKISCEDFPKPAMNLKWVSDTIDRLVAEANKAEETFSDIPLDTRHIDAKARKGKKGDHVRGRTGHRPSIRDFPKEWLPTDTSEPVRLPSSA